MYQWRSNDSLSIETGKPPATDTPRSWSNLTEKSLPTKESGNMCTEARQGTSRAQTVRRRDVGCASLRWRRVTGEVNFADANDFHRSTCLELRDTPRAQGLYQSSMHTRLFCELCGRSDPRFNGQVPRSCLVCQCNAFDEDSDGCTAADAAVHVARPLDYSSGPTTDTGRR